MKNYGAFASVGIVVLAVVVTLWLMDARGTGLSTDSGVRGVVLLGPTCPVLRDPPEPGCADKPYETAIAAYRAGSGSLVAAGTSDAAGAFEFALAPGSYTLIAAGGATLPRCSEASVTVVAGRYESVNIFCDTGIR